MKKLMLLLLMGLVAVGLVMAAAPAHPPGVPAIDIVARDTPAALPGYATDHRVVTLGTVPALAPPVWAPQTGVLVAADRYSPPVQPWRIDRMKAPLRNTGHLSAGIRRLNHEYWIRI